MTGLRRPRAAGLLAAALAAACVALAAGCPASGPEPREAGAPPEEKGTPPAPAGDGFATPEEGAKAYFQAKLARDFGRVWDLSAEEPRQLILGMAKGIAEESDAAAKDMGLASAAEAKALGPREFYVRLCQASAERGEYVYPAGARLKEVRVQPAPERGGLPARRAELLLEGGETDEVFLVREGDAWKLWEK